MVLVVLQVLKDLVELEVDLVQCLGQVKRLQNTVSRMVGGDNGLGDSLAILSTFTRRIGSATLYKSK